MVSLCEEICKILETFPRKHTFKSLGYVEVEIPKSLKKYIKETEKLLRDLSLRKGSGPDFKDSTMSLKNRWLGYYGASDRWESFQLKRAEYELKWTR